MPRPKRRPKRPQGDEEPPDEQRRSKLLPGGLREESKAASGGVPAGAGAASSDGAAASSDDLSVMRVGLKFFPAADSWQSLVDRSGQDGDSFLSFLRGAFPMLSFSGLKTVETAFLLVKKEETIQLNWTEPLCHDPENCEASKSVVYHATSSLRAPSIRHRGLLPLLHGARCPTPALYCSPLRTTCFRSYCNKVRFPTIDKVFVLILGVRGGKKKGSLKRGKSNHQIWFEALNYKVLFVQFLCTEGDQRRPEDVKAALRPGKFTREWNRRPDFHKDSDVLGRAFLRQLGHGGLGQ